LAGSIFEILGFCGSVQLVDIDNWWDGYDWWLRLWGVLVDLPIFLAGLMIIHNN